MQFLVISHQLWEILLSVIVGVFLGLIYDGVRFVRRLLHPVGFRMLAANILDVVYLVFCGAVYCVFVYYASSGRFRWFTALGMVFGFLVYRFLPGRFIKPILFFIADKLILLISFIFFPVKKAVILFLRLNGKALAGVSRVFKIRKTERMKRKLSSEVKIVE